MFKILGADGKEYGPVSIDQIIRWIGEGRANQETMAMRQCDTGWKPLSQHPEFADALGIKPPVVGGAAPSPAPGAPPVAAAAADASVAARAGAIQKINGPAIGLMVTGGLGIVSNLFSVVIHLVRTVPPPTPAGLPPEFTRWFELMNGPVGLALALITMIIGVFVLFGGYKMQRLQGRVLAMVTAIVAIVPCFSPCCVLGIPMGIWALVVLAKPEVRSQFDR